MRDNNQHEWQLRGKSKLKITFSPRIEEETSRSRKWRWWVVAGLLLVILLGVGVWGLRRGPRRVVEPHALVTSVTDTNTATSVAPEEAVVPDVPLGSVNGLSTAEEADVAVRYGRVRIVANTPDYARAFLSNTAKRVRLDANNGFTVQALPHIVSNAVCGATDVKLEAAGFKADAPSRHILIQEGRTSDVAFLLTPLPATLLLACDVKDAVAQIGNVKFPVTNVFSVASLQPVRVTVTAAGSPAQVLDLGPYEPLTTNRQVVALRRAVGALRIDATVPTNAAAFFQGLEKQVMIFSNGWKTVTSLPYVAAGLPCEEVPVDLVVTGFQRVGTAPRTARVREAQTNAVLFQLNPLPAKLSVVSNIKGKIAEPEQVRARHILVATDPKDAASTKEEKKARAGNILGELTAGADFGALAKKYSDCPSKARGGDLGIFGRGQMVKSFENAVFALPVNQLSGVVETQFGYHIIQVLERIGGPMEKAEAPILTVKCEPAWLGLSTEANPQSVPSLQPLTITVSASGYVAQVVKLGPLEPDKEYRQEVQLEPATVVAGMPGPGETNATMSVDLGGGVTLEFVWCPAGEFMMGSVAEPQKYKTFDSPPHKVILTKGFWLGKYEVTQKQWERIMGHNPSTFKDPDNPVENVSWNDSHHFIYNLNLANPAYRFRLPTEAEWEYACRASATTMYNTGNATSDLDRAGWHGGNSGEMTHPVGQKAPNQWGLYDMHGNVEEWCYDFYGPYPDGTVTNPIGATSGGTFGARVTRGQTWSGNYPYYGGCGRLLAHGIEPYWHSNYQGLRLVCVPRAESTDSPPAGKDSKRSVVDLGDGVTMSLVWIPPGDFIMGSATNEPHRFPTEGPQHRVRFTNGFWLGQYEVTQKQYQRVMGENPSAFKGDEMPVENVDWHQAREFCEKTSAILGEKARLPTEAEWEYACRAGTTTAFYYGHSLDPTMANYNDRFPAGKGPHRTDQNGTSEVGSFAPNAWGAYDMHGNVWEWCEDWSHEKYNGAPDDGSAWLVPAGKYRVTRGGSWFVDPDFCRSSIKSANVPEHKADFVGFRVVVASN